MGSDGFVNLDGSNIAFVKKKNGISVMWFSIKFSFGGEYFVFYSKLIFQEKSYWRTHWPKNGKEYSFSRDIRFFWRKEFDGIMPVEKL